MKSFMLGPGSRSAFASLALPRRFLLLTLQFGGLALAAVLMRKPSPAIAASAH